MERAFKCPAMYRKFIEAELALAIAATVRDMQRRAVGRRPTIPETFRDDTAVGDTTVCVRTPNPSHRVSRPRRRTGVST